jgi:Glycosyl transferase family 2
LPDDVRRHLPDGLEWLGPAPQPAPGEIIALLVTRNEALRLPAALAHLRRQGVDRSYVIDNLSEDATREIAAGQNWVHLMHAPGSYAGSGFGIEWTNAVLDQYARDHWVLVVDADELLVYPGCEAHDLHALCAHLDSIGAEALRTILLDCFPGGPLHALSYAPGEALTEAAPFFEPPTRRAEPVPNFPYEQEYGGVRERLFFPETEPHRPLRLLHQKAWNAGAKLGLAKHFAHLAPRRSPTITKLPLIRWREGAALLASTHQLAPMRLVSGQPSGVLLHFKFLQDFHERAVDAVQRNAHWDGSREYRRYLAALRRDPEFSLRGSRSLRYDGPDQLTALGLMHDSPGWMMARDPGAP